MRVHKKLVAILAMLLCVAFVSVSCKDTPTPPDKSDDPTSSSTSSDSSNPTGETDTSNSGNTNSSDTDGESETLDGTSSNIDDSSDIGSGGDNAESDNTNTSTGSDGNSGLDNVGDTDNVKPGNTPTTGTSTGTATSKVADFLTYKKIDLTDTEEIMAMLGEVPDPSDVDMYDIHADGGLIYNPIYQEAEVTDMLDKYDGAATYTGTLKLENGSVLKYSVPKNVTAYDPVPVTYEVTKSDAAVDALHISVTNYEELDRMGDNAYYDCALPNDVDVKVEYLGYVDGTYIEGADASLSADFTNDELGTQYPNYSTTDLTYSGTVNSTDITWFRFKYTNVGDTILDGEGTGAFHFEPVLYKKNGAGQYEQVSTTENKYQRLLDYVYPGESGEFWVSFLAQSLSAGEYRIVLNKCLRNLRSENGTYKSYYNCGSATFDFTVASTAQVTPPKAVVNTKTAITRNTWMHTLEEFMTSFESLLDASVKTESGTIWAQPCPWAEGFTIRFIYGNSGDSMAQVTVPVKVESDSVKVELNTENDNYVIQEDGSRYPAITTQWMMDMRGNVQRSPYVDDVLVNDVLDMQEAGINLIALTHVYSTDVDDDHRDYQANAFKFAMEILRETPGMQIEGLGIYPYWTRTAIDVANKLGDTIKAKDYTGYGDPAGSEAVTRLANYLFKRYGDLYWENVTNKLNVTLEDNRGWIRFDLDNRYAIGSSSLLNFRNWLTKVYGNVTNLNKAYGSHYDSIQEINPEADAVQLQEGGYYTYNNLLSTYSDWSKAVMDFDIYRTLERVERYQEIVDQLAGTKDGMGDVQLIDRHESGIWVVGGINPDTKNMRYRQSYYGQRRNATIAEILASSGLVYADSDYMHIAYRPSEVAELTARSVEQGIIPMHLPSFSSMEDIALNSKYGDIQGTSTFNTASLTYDATVTSVVSLFTWWKATYENGGIPGNMMYDYTVDIFCTSTQYKEMKFFKQKLEEALATPEGVKWSTDFDAADYSVKENSYVAKSYTSEYVQQVIADTKRVCVYTDRNGI